MSQEKVVMEVTAQGYKWTLTDSKGRVYVSEMRMEKIGLARGVEGSQDWYDILEELNDPDLEEALEGGDPFDIANVLRERAELE